jgi:hypothetical protein
MLAGTTGRFSLHHGCEGQFVVPVAYNRSVRATWAIMEAWGFHGGTDCYG